MHCVIICCGAAVQEWVDLPGWGCGAGAGAGGGGGGGRLLLTLFSLSVSDDVQRPNTLVCLERLKTE